MNGHDPRRKAGNRPAQSPDRGRTDGRAPGRPTSGQRPPQRPPQRPAGARPMRPQDMSDALNERYEEMVSPRGRADDINRGKYADLSTFESRGHRKIDPALMRAKKRAELIRKLIPVGAVCLVAAVGLGIYFGFIRPGNRYQKAVELFEAGDYSSAEKIFRRLGERKDSRDYVAYIDARAAYRDGDYSTAQLIFNSLGDFYDSRDMAVKADGAANGGAEKESTYNGAVEMMKKGDYKGAYAAFGQLGDYLDSRDQAERAKKEIDYAEALRLLAIGDEEGARVLFLSLGDFKDSASRLSQIDGPADDRAQKYEQGMSAIAIKDWRTANNIFNSISGYRDSKLYVDYSYAKLCYDNRDYGTAWVCFEACGSLLDSPEMTLDAKYLWTMEIYSSMDSSKLPQVIEMFRELGSYSDSEQMLSAACDQYRTEGIFAYNDGDSARALEIFEFLGGYGDCAEWAQRIRNESAV